MPSAARSPHPLSAPLHPKQGRQSLAHLRHALRSALAATGLLLIFASSAFPADSSEPRSVLILMAGEYGLPAYDLILHEIRRVVKEGYSSPLNWYAEYMDTARFSDFQEEKAVIDFYSQKYRALTIDLLIAIGPSLRPVFRRFGDRLFQGAPTLILDVLPPGVGLPDLFRKPNMTGVFPSADLQGSIDAALALHPDMEQLVIISGASDMDRLVGELALKASRRYEGRIAVRHFSGMPLPELLAAVKALPDHSVILVTAYHLSMNGTAYYTREVTRELAVHANLPIYVMFESNVDVGVVGGHVISFKTVGLEAGRIALRILHGEDPAAIPPVREGLLQYQFDRRQLRRWGIREDRLPEGSVVLNRQVTFFEQYFWGIMGMLAFVALQAALIAYLVILNRRQSTMSKQLRRAEGRYRELLRIERSTRLGEMAGSLAHELSQPLTAILSSAQAALRFLKTGPPQPDLLRKILEQIVGDDKRAASIISGLRNMLKKGPAASARLDVNAVVGEVAAIFQGEAINHRIRVESRLDPALPPVMADKIQLQQVFLNLMINAAQAMASTLEDDRRLILATRREGPNVVVSVRDAGPGIDSVHMERLFEPLFTTRSEGMGMGLAVCRSIVEDHGGRIWGMNNPARGATFTIELPAAHHG